MLTLRRTPRPTESVLPPAAPVPATAAPATAAPATAAPSAPTGPPGLDLEALGLHLLDRVPINVMVADLTMTIRYINQASLQTLQRLAHLIPVRPDQVVGSHVDIFHRQPAGPREVLGRRDLRSHNAIIVLGDELLELQIEPLRTDGTMIGHVLTWWLVTDRERIRNGMRELASTVASSVTELEASIAEIARSAAESAQIALEAAESTSHASQQMAELSSRVEDISRVVSFIAGVASQTNLLALNATIESARAGEAGKGFAVVAHEVKQLAGATSQSTGDIRNAVEAIVSGVVAARATVTHSSEVMAGLTERSSSIAAAVEEQNSVLADFARFATLAAESAARDDR